MPGTVRSSRDTSVSKTDKDLCSPGADFSPAEWQCSVFVFKGIQQEFVLMEERNKGRIKEEKEGWKLGGRKEDLP